MESNTNSNLSWLQGNEQDFPLGAKATSFLLPATNDEISFTNDYCLELPDFMESQDVFGFSNGNLLENIECMEDPPFETAKDDFNREFINGSNLSEDIEENYCGIQPEDMLVPLSELQPDKYAATPQGIGANTLFAASDPSSSTSVTKIPIRVNRIKVQKVETQNLDVSYIPLSYASLPLQQNPNYQVIDPCNINENIIIGDHIISEQLLNELVDMVKCEPNQLTDMISSLDKSVFQDGMEELLSHLESIETKATVSGVPQCTSEPFSPECISSPVPSYGSVSPHQDMDQSFLDKTESYTLDNLTLPSEDETASLCSVSSPLYEESITLSSQSCCEDEESVVAYDKPELHSHSRSQRKRKNRSGFPEGRKERKKEQNKQAALRYRQKKKQEEDELMAQIKAEEERQKKLKVKYIGLKQELACMKKIMREVLKARGIVPGKDFQKK
ncbi:hypothetical protein SK128_006471 [Halocaridina rubra]|uniref:BZIP domain-containing protein n=1 Tax=Halocaridina rubra TaxID=373956 RepID=A0AAN8XID4_HALRR